VIALAALRVATARRDMRDVVVVLGEWDGVVIMTVGGVRGSDGDHEGWEAFVRVLARCRECDPSVSVM
jgi:hypothetical protein